LYKLLEREYFDAVVDRTQKQVIDMMHVCKREKMEIVVRKICEIGAN
jgi:16S rRNA U1498 N3-methylase RsmE